VHCGKTADRIRVSFGIIVRTGPGMRQVLAICPLEGVLSGPHLGRAIVTIVRQCLNVGPAVCGGV